MRVVSFINGSMISETSSAYALHYAKMLGAQFNLVHIKSKDSFIEVQKSADYLTSLASSYEIENEFLTFETLGEFVKYADNKDIDVMFCSTKQNHSILDRSFAQTIIKSDIKADLAVVKVVKLSREKSVERIIMPIRNSKLSVKKFSFFTAFTFAYDAKAEIYSVDKCSRGKMATIDILKRKNRLQEIIFNLRHYLRIAKILDFKFSIKHDYAFAQGDNVKTHIAKHDYDLLIIGGHHYNSFFGKHPIDILFKNPMINTIYFIPYKDEQ